MATPDRSFADVLRDIGQNIQEILRSEVRLAKAEISEEARKAKPAGVWIAIGAVSRHGRRHDRPAGRSVWPLDRDAELGGRTGRECCRAPQSLAFLPEPG